MAFPARCCFVLVILGAGVQVQGIWNFRAVGEYLIADVESCDQEFSVDFTRYFEEVYYSDGASINKTALRVDAKDEDASAFFGDFKEKRVFWQLGDESCTDKVGDNDTTMPHFKPWSFGSEAVYAPIYVTLAELRYRTIDDISNVTERGLDAERVPLDLGDATDKDIYVEKAYLIFEKLDDENYDYDNLIPLSVEICMNNNNARTIERLSIVEFAWNTTVEEDASPQAGAPCNGYGRSDSSLLKVFDVSTVVLRTEQVRDKNVTTGDIALDFERKLLRIDNGVNDYFLSASQNTLYNVANPDTRTQSCESLVADEQAKLDWTFVDFSVESAKEFFKVDENSRVRTKTKRRGIECDVVSSIREDYLPELGPESVWEWCIGDIKTAEGVQKYMVNLDIFIRMVNGTLYRESYSLYDVESVEQKKLYADYFTELEPCFGIDRKRNLQVTVDGQESSSYSDDDVETAIESGLFKAALLDVILRESGLNPDSYRFGSPEARIINGKEAVFQFLLFDAPKNAPEDQRMDRIYDKLQKAVSESTLAVDVNGIKFSIRKDSLTEAHDIPERTTTPAPVTSESPATDSIPDTHSTTTSAATDSIPDIHSTTKSDATTTEKDNGSDLPEVSEGYQGALVYGVAFAVLLVGGGVGVVAGNKILLK